MATRKTYRCSACYYECHDYEGIGFMRQHIVSMSCPDCKTIQPLVVGGIIGNNAPSFNGLAGRLCLNCGSNKIAIWDKKTCPKCGGQMLFTGDQSFWT